MHQEEVKTYRPARHVDKSFVNLWLLQETIKVVTVKSLRKL